MATRDCSAKCGRRIEIQCIDCHGTSTTRAELKTSGPAAYTSGPDGTRDLTALRTPSGRRRFEVEGNKIFQNSMVEPNLRWEIVQTLDTIDSAERALQRQIAHGQDRSQFDDFGKLAWGGKPERMRPSKRAG